MCPSIRHLFADDVTNDLNDLVNIVALETMDPASHPDASCLTFIRCFKKRVRERVNSKANVDYMYI